MLRYALRSETGKVRANNEDNCAIKILDGATVMIIADGMGGEAGGEIASAIAVEYMADKFDNELKDVIATISEEDLKDKLAQYYRDANKKILLKAVEDHDLFGMGTTLTVAVIRGTRLLIAHLGDSRAYLLHGSSITQLTSDHNLAAELLKNAMISLEESKVHPGRHILVRCLGENAYLNPDFYGYNIIYGDVVLLCTDGLYSYLEDKDIVKCMHKHNRLEECLDNLFGQAYEAGSDDNITVLLVHVKP